MLNPKELPAPLRLKYIVEAMAMRARGRAEIKAAEAKRALKAQKRAKSRIIAIPAPIMRKHMGVVDDAYYGNSVHLGCRAWTHDVLRNTPLDAFFKNKNGRTSYNPQVGV